jgi:hypothetical protein
MPYPLFGWCQIICFSFLLLCFLQTFCLCCFSSQLQSVCLALQWLVMYLCFFTKLPDNDGRSHIRQFREHYLMMDVQLNLYPVHQVLVAECRLQLLLCFLRLSLIWLHCVAAMSMEWFLHSFILLCGICICSWEEAKVLKPIDGHDVGWCLSFYFLFRVEGAWLDDVSGSEMLRRYMI